MRREGPLVPRASSDEKGRGASERQERVGAQTWQGEAGNARAAVTETAQKKNGRRVNRIYGQTRDVPPTSRRPVKHKAVWLQTH